MDQLRQQAHITVTFDYEFQKWYNNKKYCEIKRVGRTEGWQDVSYYSKEYTIGYFCGFGEVSFSCSIAIPFLAYITILHHLKTLQNLWFSGGITCCKGDLIMDQNQFLIYCKDAFVTIFKTLHRGVSKIFSSIHENIHHIFYCKKCYKKLFVISH